MDDGTRQRARRAVEQEFSRDMSLRQRVISVAQNLANKLNAEIEKGNDTGAFLIAISLAVTKDFLDLVLTLLLIGLIPGVSFLLGLFLTSFLFFFMLGKGWLLKWRLRFWFWFWGLFFDSLPALNVLPTNTILVLYAWRQVKKRASKAELDLGSLATLTEREMHALDEQLDTLER